MKLYRRLATVPGASIPQGYGILWGDDFIKAACVDERRGREILWTGPDRYETEVALADAWAHATGIKRDDNSQCYPAGYDVVCHHTADDCDHPDHDRYQAVFELEELDTHQVTASWTGEMRETRPAAITDTWIHASGYKPETILH